MTVAVRGLPVSSDISPKFWPGPISVSRKSMLVLGSFLRTSTLPLVMKNMEVPGAPSRTMTVAGGKSRRRMRLTTCWQSSLLRVLNSLMRCKKCAASAALLGASAGAAAAAAAGVDRDGLGSGDGGAGLGIRRSPSSWAQGEGLSIYQVVSHQ